MHFIRYPLNQDLVHIIQDERDAITDIILWICIYSTTIMNEAV